MNLKVYVFGSLLILVLVAASCSGEPRTPAEEPGRGAGSRAASESKEEPGMTDEQFDALSKRPTRSSKQSRIN
jgi:hypothetical protein